MNMFVENFIILLFYVLGILRSRYLRLRRVTSRADSASPGSGLFPRHRRLCLHPVEFPKMDPAMINSTNSVSTARSKKPLTTRRVYFGT